MATGTPGVFDSDETFDYLFAVGRRISLVVEMSFWIRFREFTAPATAAVAGGVETTTSGGGSTPSSSSAAAHRHQMTNGNSAPTGIGNRTVAAQNASGSAQILFDLATNASALHTYSADGAHQHTVTIPAHDHDVPAHGHGLEYGIFKEPMPASIDVNIGLWHRPFEGGEWALIGSIAGLNQAEQYVDVTSMIDNQEAAAGLWRLTFQSAAGQPNNGRLTVDVVHEGAGAMQSA